MRTVTETEDDVTGDNIKLFTRESDDGPELTEGIKVAQKGGHYTTVEQISTYWIKRGKESKKKNITAIYIEARTENEKEKMNKGCPAHTRRHQVNNISPQIPRQSNPESARIVKLLTWFAESTASRYQNALLPAKRLLDYTVQVTKEKARVIADIIKQLRSRT
ncbi:hypothetical protein FQR65_LT18907 [Abscondita terminalis]|nr:hypothetical protein FQR65_LT18907 [Abscondita terminalis]